MSRRSAGEGTKRKRTAGEGSLRKRYKKDGSEFYEWRLTLPGGKRVSFYADKERDVKQKVKEAKQLIDQGLPLPDDRLTVAKYLTRWLEGRRSLKPRTWERYREIIVIHIIPALGHIPLARLTSDQINQMYTAKERAGLSKTTVHHLHAVLHKALGDALMQGLVLYNATERIPDPPCMPRHKTTKPPLTHDESLRLLAKAGETRWQRWEALFVLALTTGLREGELLALRWDDVHLNDTDPFLEVNENLYFLHGVQFGTPKSEDSERNVLLIPRAVEALRAHEHLQKLEKVAASRWDKPEEPYNLIFPNTVGMPVSANNFIVRVFHRMLEETALPSVRFHDLRHCAATFLLKEGVPPYIVAAILGHADAAFTMYRYGHRDVEMQQPAVKVMHQLFGKG